MTENETTAMAVVQQTPTDLPMIAHAIDKGLSPEQLEKLIGLQERVIAHNAKQAYTKAMNEAQQKIGPIYKDRENRFMKGADGKPSRYPSLEGIMSVLHPIIVAHGFSLSFTEIDGGEPGWVKMRLDINHVGGHSERREGKFPYDDAGSKGGSNKTLIQAVGSACTYGRRYLLGLAFNLVFTDHEGKSDDEDGNLQVESPQGPYQDKTKIDRSMVALLIEMVSEKGADKGRLLTWAAEKQKQHISDYGDLWVSTFREACAMLQKKPSKEKKEGVVS